MNNDTFNLSELNAQLAEQTPQGVSSDDAFADLNALFSDARATEPRLGSELSDENFTKLVMNSVPTKLKRGSIFQRSAKSGVSFDLLGLGAGVAATYALVDLRSVTEFILSAVPSSFTMSPTLLAGAVLSVGVVSLAAWWSVEEPLNG